MDMTRAVWEKGRTARDRERVGERTVIIAGQGINLAVIKKTRDYLGRGKPGVATVDFEIHRKHL